ncbi:shikimate dehydrogenase [Ornithinimicrobium sp. Y1694]|uniref:shikimate dehydrogenase n=1 Tax=Ornithinimicrobium sp. Y1694 TaxID=3418590 RepID=UPI003CE72B22
MTDRQREEAPAPRRAGVIGSPIAHSLSPVLHRSAYAALGLGGWTYTAAEVGSGELAAHVAGLPDDWIGLSVTMPGKEEALELASSASPRALLTGAANTLVRSTDGTGWHADNTDVEGLVRALREAGRGCSEASRSPLEGGASGVVIGGGATARSALLAVAELGITEVDLWVRTAPRPETAALIARREVGLAVRVRRFAEGTLVIGEAGQRVVVSTLPAQAPAPRLRLAQAPETAPETGGPDAQPTLLDVLYAPWPSSFATAVAALGPAAPVVHDGTGMLLHQAARQVELMTGHDGPVEAMRAALTAEGERRQAAVTSGGSPDGKS